MAKNRTTSKGVFKFIISVICNIAQPQASVVIARFVANKATPKQMMRWAKGALVFPGDIGKVVLMGEHLMYQDKMLALLDIDGAYYLVDADNLEVV